MPSIRKRNGRYQVQVRVLGRQKSATFNSRNDAKRWAALTEAELLGFISSREKYKPENISEILTKYLIHESPKKSGHDVEKYILKRSVKIADIKDNLDIHRLGALQISDLERINKYKMALAVLNE